MDPDALRVEAEAIVLPPELTSEVPESYSACVAAGPGITDPYESVLRSGDEPAPSRGGGGGGGDGGAAGLSSIHCSASLMLIKLIAKYMNMLQVKDAPLLLWRKAWRAVPGLAMQDQSLT